MIMEIMIILKIIITIPINMKTKILLVTTIRLMILITERMITTTLMILITERVITTTMTVIISVAIIMSFFILQCIP